MNILKALWISLVISLWAILFIVFLPRACDIEHANQAAKNASYSDAEWVPQQSLGGYYGKR